MNEKTKLFVMISILMIVFANIYTQEKTVAATEGQISLFNNYTNMSGLKHDFFKLFFINFIAGLLIDNPTTIFSMDQFHTSLFGAFDSTLLRAAAFSAFKAMVSIVGEGGFQLEMLEGAFAVGSVCWRVRSMVAGGSDAVSIWVECNFLRQNRDMAARLSEQNQHAIGPADARHQH